MPLPKGRRPERFAASFAHLFRYGSECFVLQCKNDETITRFRGTFIAAMRLAHNWKEVPHACEIQSSAARRRRGARRQTRRNGEIQTQGRVAIDVRVDVGQAAQGFRQDEAKAAARQESRPRNAAASCAGTAVSHQRRNGARPARCAGASRSSLSTDLHSSRSRRAPWGA